MRNFWKALLALAVIAAGVAFWAPGPGASSDHFVVVNDNNLNQMKGQTTATVLDFVNGANPSLQVAKTLLTRAKNEDSTGGLNQVAMSRQGPNVCIFVGDNINSAIASFQYPSYVKAGDYHFPGVTQTANLAVAARGDYVYGSFGNDEEESNVLGVWKIGSGCALSLANQASIPDSLNSMAVSPDGKTLVVVYFTLTGELDSFSIGANGSLTEHGPYQGGFALPGGVDITADSRFAVIGQTGDPAYTQIGIWSITSDGGLGTDYIYGGNGELGYGLSAGWVWLSPNEKFLFVTDVSGRVNQVTTLNFNEGSLGHPQGIPTVTYTGCFVKSQAALLGGLATALPSGSGGYLYVDAYDNPHGRVALYSINPENGCLKAVPGSPFATGQNGGVTSLAGWPPRPF